MFDLLDWPVDEGLGCPQVYVAWMAKQVQGRVQGGLAFLYMQVHRIIDRDDVLGRINAELFDAEKVTALYARTRIFYGVHAGMFWAYPKVFRYV